MQFRADVVKIESENALPVSLPIWQDFIFTPSLPTCQVKKYESDVNPLA
jgi:hypothetical protein